MDDLRPFDLEELELIHRYYEHQRGMKDKDGRATGIHRRDLTTFLNNYQTEADRARQWAREHPRLAARPLGKAEKKEDSEPADFRAKFDAEFPSKAGTPWKDVPEDVRRKVR